jgi:hypothetical protein
MTNEQLDILIEALEGMRKHLIANGGIVPPPEAISAADAKKQAYLANQMYFVTEAMENFPEASEYGALRCIKWDYANMLFTFQDTEDFSRHYLSLGGLMVAADLVLTPTWGKGLTALPPDLFDRDTDYIGDTLCQMDGYDFMALVEIALFGEMTYC